ncbi:MAG: HD domain-containing phosphohydrolase [Proteocatella sp.]
MNKLIYNNFLNNVQDPIWIVDLDCKYVYANDAYKKCHSINLDVTGKDLLEIIPGKLAEEYIEHVEKIIRKKEYMIFEEELHGKVIQCRAFPMLDASGEIEAVGGLIIDITESVSREKEIVYDRNLLQNVVDAIPEIIFLKDSEGRYQFINKTCKDFYQNRGINHVIGKMDIEINPDKENSLKLMEVDQKVLRDKNPVTIESHIKISENEIKIKESLKSPLINKEGNAVGIVGISRDVTEKKILEKRLRYLSYTDMLTGVYNRASFEGKIKELKNTRKTPIGIIMGDVNGLKLINDTFGHIEGDKILVSISNVLKKVCGEYGHIFRWGGDEFVVLIPNADEKICEDVMKNIKTECISTNHDLIELSISMGLSIFKFDDDIDKKLKEAEEKVYKHKLLEQKSTLSGAINSLQESLEAKSHETKEHTHRMTKLVSKLGKKMKLSTSQLDELEIATRLHDIGKIGIREDILLKPGKLTEQEYQIIKTHTEKGYRIVMASNGLDSVAKTVLTHHERWDGKGYPLGLKQKEIPLSARIISVVDAYDAMTNNRIYRDGIKKEDAIKEIENSRGTQFDPHIAGLFIQIMKQRKKR